MTLNFWSSYFISWIKGARDWTHGFGNARQDAYLWNYIPSPLALVKLWYVLWMGHKFKHGIIFQILLALRQFYKVFIIIWSEKWCLMMWDFPTVVSFQCSNSFQFGNSGCSTWICHLLEFSLMKIGVYLLLLLSASLLLLPTTAYVLTAILGNGVGVN